MPMTQLPTLSSPDESENEECVKIYKILYADTSSSQWAFQSYEMFEWTDSTWS